MKADQVQDNPFFLNPKGSFNTPPLKGKWEHLTEKCLILSVSISLYIKYCAREKLNTWAMERKVLCQIPPLPLTGRRNGVPLGKGM